MFGGHVGKFVDCNIQFCGHLLLDSLYLSCAGCYLQFPPMINYVSEHFCMAGSGFLLVL